ncbi:MAG TPA: hypothetical protein VFR88_05350, partial [Microlunatus sp.]|nr:hypothetical protein [Microlunatus sp.]
MTDRRGRQRTAPPVRIGRPEFVDVGLEDLDELRVDRHATDFVVGPVLEGDALADLARVGPAAAGFARQGEVGSAVGGLLRSECGVVHAGKEGFEVTPAFTVRFDGGEESVRLVG